MNSFKNTTCPDCGAGDLEYGTPELAKKCYIGAILLPTECECCGSKWTAVYHATGFIAPIVSPMSELENKMRKCEVFKWDWTGCAARPNKVLDVEDAIFHRFSIDYEELSGGTGTFPVAIVECQDGRVLLPRADMIRFVK